MSQTTLTSFFNSRKRPAADDIVSTKNKIPHISRTLDPKAKGRLGSALINNEVSSKAVSKDLVAESHKKLDSVRKGLVSPQKSDELKPSTAFTKKVNASNVERPVEVVKSDVNAARKELSLGDIRKRLAGSSRLSELKASAERISQGIQKLKETSGSRNLKEFKSIHLEVPTSPSKKVKKDEILQPNEDITSAHKERPLISPRKVFVSPVKSPSKVPAYIRHASLAQSATSLPLQHHYRFLAELFRGMETVVALLYNRNEKITFNKLKPSIQEMLKRNFNEKHLAQIKQLVPDFYSYEVQKIKNFSTSAQKEAHELVITPNIPNDIKVMNPTVLLERRRYFYDTLLQLTKKHHSQYLSSLDPPMVIPEDKLTRWHPEFDVEKVPEVDTAKLPEMPNAGTYSSAQDVLSKARELFKCNTKMERALEKLAQAKTRGLTDQEKSAINGKDVTKAVNANTQTTQPPPSTSAVTLINPALRNLPAALLEKVKAKQAAKALEAMTRPSEHQEKYLTFTRLPDLARTLRNIYVTERKNVLALNVILSKLGSSFKSNVSASNLQKDIQELANAVPEFLKLHDIRNTTYLKLDKNADLNKVTSKLEAFADKLK